ncbi:MAG: hypothetical protein WAM97_07065 [Acidimicrobiales bacterium]|jgi:Mce-associated membrane protein
MTEVMRRNGSRPGVDADLELELEELDHLDGAPSKRDGSGHTPGYKAPKVAKAQKAVPKSDERKLNGHGSAAGLWAQIAEEVTNPPADEVAAPKKQQKTSLKKSAAKKSTGEKKSSASKKSSLSEIVEQSDDVEFADPVEDVEDVTEFPEEQGTTETGSATKRAKVGRFGFTYATLIVSVIAAALVVALILTSISLSSKSSLEGARTSALASARTYAAEMAGYTYQNLTHDFAVVESNSTPAFQHNFLLSSNALKSTLVKYHASATASIVSAGIVSATATSATVLLLVDQKVKNSVEKNSTTDRNQLLMNLSHVNGKWLISNVTEL